MKVINTKIIQNWFDNLSYKDKFESCQNHFNHTNIEMLSLEDIVILYIKVNGVK